MEDYTPAAEAPKKNNTVLIVVIVIAVVLLCCCCCSLVLAWQYGDAILRELNINTGLLSLSRLI